eukprot:TRINITY_DN25204_c0_g1_i1.p1 TRINITY_DN25204_c0_g1~~TRINITY_DN25204_c0_g1_i1.p1  ORF type:complete len:332 (-),score=71.03 TRINITY_DN25204_c0_g1_i1:107-1030(-)
MSGEVVLGLCYYDERMQDLRRQDRLPDEEERNIAWQAAAKELRSALLSAAKAAGLSEPRVEVVGRWKRRRLFVERDYVVERCQLSDGRTLVYKQPEGQFSNPNADCEVHCLEWLCRETKLLTDASPAMRLLELHCGGGTNTVAIAPYCDSVVAVEINRTLAEAAEENLNTNQIQNVELLRTPSAALDPVIAAGCNTVLVDPPRSGLDAETRSYVAKFDNMLYISCNPACLAADLEFLGSDFEVVKFAIFDMFPYTTHAECAVRVRRRRRRLGFFSDKGWASWALPTALAVVVAIFAMRKDMWRTRNQ